MACLALSETVVGDVVAVSALQGGRQFRSRLLNLGVFPGQTLHVLQGRSTSGGRIVAIGAHRVAIGGGMSDKIEVRRIYNDSAGKAGFGRKP